MLGGGTVKDLYELVGQGASIRTIARRLGISRNTVRKYLRSPGVPKFKPGLPRLTKLENYREHVLRRVRDGVENCVVLMRELREQGYTGGFTILKEFVQPLRVRSSVNATMRFETEPGEQAQVDFGSFPYLSAEGVQRRVWGFVMVLSWSRMIYVEFVPRADVATFIRCHINAFEALGGMVRRCLLSGIT
jgi:transposase